MNDYYKTEKRSYGIRMLYLAILAFGALAGAIAFVFYTRGGNFTKDDIQITIEAPERLDGGAEASIDVILSNNSKIDIQDARISVYLPEELVFLNGEDLAHYDVETIRASGDYRIPLDIVSISTDASVNIEARAAYSPKNINFRFQTARLKHEIIIGSLDAEAIINIPEKIYIQENVSGSILITPSSSFQKTTLYARLIAPEEFEVSQADPGFTRDLSWRLNNLESGVEQVLEFQGLWKGESNSFDITVEIGKYDGIKFLPFLSIKKSINVSSSPLLVSVIKDNNEYSVRSKSKTTVDFVIRNQGDKTLNNARIVAIVPEDFIDISSLDGGSGVQISGNEVEWSHSNFPALKKINPKEESKVSLTFSLRDFPSIRHDSVSEFKILTRATASLENRGSLSDSGERVFLLSGDPEFSQQVVRSSNIFDEYGPMPPVAGEKTGYVVVWNIKNSSNALHNIKVEARLPSYAEWGQEVSNKVEEFFYDDDTNSILWEIERLEPFAEREISFVVFVKPPKSYIGEVARILSRSSFMATDSSTKDLIEERLPSVNSDLPSDDSVSFLDGVVIE